MNTDTGIGPINPEPKNENDSGNGERGEKTKSYGMIRETGYQNISDRDALLINEIIYDLISKRILTPGVNRSNLDLPHVHVSDMDKLEIELRKIQ